MRAPTSDGAEAKPKDEAYDRIVVAHCMGPGPAPLGLGEPLALLGGGDRLAPSGIAATIGIDHVGGLRTFVAEACRAQALAGRDWYQQPPLALLSDHGVGKGFAARWIARNAGLPLYRMPVTGEISDAGTASSDIERRLPALPLIAMSASRCANPIVVAELDIDRLPAGQMEEDLVRMIDPRRNARWMDVEHDAFFDLSHVSWIVEVHGRPPRGGVLRVDEPRPIDPALPSALSALIEDVGRVLVLDAPFELEDLRRLDVAAEICAGAGATDRETIAAVHDVLASMPRSRREHLPCASLVQAAQRLVAVRQSAGGA